MRLDPDSGQSGEWILAISAPDVSLRDEQIPVRITGANPGAAVTLTAETEDLHGTTWRSEATFAADRDGVVDMTTDAPESGSYDGIAPMGWLWAMRAESEATVTGLRNSDRNTVTLRAETSEQRTVRTIERRVASPDVERRPVESDDVAGTFFEPPGDGPHPGVLALHGSGGDPETSVAALLATRGFATLALQYSGDPDPVPDRLVRVPLSYVERAATWLRDRQAVRDGQVGVFGRSRGGELALLLGARYEWVGAVVSYAGSGVAYNTPYGPSAWIENGDPIPHVTASEADAREVDDGTAPMLERALEDASAETIRDATILVEETDGPILLVSGGDDPVWPARHLSEIAADRLRDKEFEYHFEHRTYGDAGHYVTEPYLPKADPAFGGSPAGLAAADADAWLATLALFEESL